MKRTIWMLLMMLCGWSAAWAQTQAGGRVLDEKNEGIIGATIQVKGSSVGTVTDADGAFMLTVPDGSGTLVISAIGYKTQEVNAGSGLTIRMQTAARALDEQVVTANAVRRQKRSLGYSTTQVTGAELTAGGSTSPLNALVGKAAGVNITTTANQPGSSSRIVLRGGSSLLGNNQALIVVDGVPINNSSIGAADANIGGLSNQVDYGNRANDINPEDIASINVLKGPAATAQYGSLASNGAIIITTKRGIRKAGVRSKTDIEVSSAFELSTILKYPDFQNRYGQGNIYEGIYDDRRENFSWGREFNNENRPWGQIIDGKQRVKKYSALPDNVRDFFNIGQTYNNNVAVNGGNEQASFRLGLGSLNSKLIYPGKEYNRYNVTFNGNANLTNKFYASISINYNKIASDLPGTGQGGASVIDNLYQTPRDIPITEGRDLNDRFNSMNYLDAQGVARYGYFNAYTINPYYTLDQYLNNNNVDRVYGNFIIGYNLFEGFRLENRLAADVISDRRYQRAPKYFSIAADELPSTAPLYDGLPHSYQGRYAENVLNTNNLYNDLMLLVDRKLGDDLNLTGIVGLNYTQFRTTSTFASTNEEGGLVVADYYFLQNSNGKSVSISDQSLQRRVGEYAELSLGYKNFAFLGGTFRNDKSSTVKSSYQYGGVNASFVLSEFFSDNIRKAWNFGKIRASFGTVGNDASPYYNATYYNLTQSQGGFGSTVFPFGSVGGFSYGNRLGNPSIQPERTTEFEVGTEQSFFNNRLTIDFSYYTKNSINQILPVSISPASGFTDTIINAGRITNQGIELAVRGTVLNMRNGPKVELYGTYTRNRNEVKEIYEGTTQVVLGGFSGMSVVAAVGHPYGEFYSTTYLKNAAGQTVVDSATGLPRLTTTSTYLGNYLPKFQASWGTTISYKSVSLNVLFDTKQGGKFYSRTRDITGFVGTSEESGDRDPKVWENSVYETSDGDQFTGQYVNNTKAYSPYSFFTSAGIRPNSANLVDASYVKLREARLTWVLPVKWLSKTWIGGASLSVYGNNLFIWTPAENKYVDPEVNSNGASNVQGFDFSAQPSLRNYGINLRLTL